MQSLHVDDRSACKGRDKEENNVMARRVGGGERPWKQRPVFSTTQRARVYTAGVRNGGGSPTVIVAYLSEGSLNLESYGGSVQRRLLADISDAHGRTHKVKILQPRWRDGRPCCCCCYYYCCLCRRFGTAVVRMARDITKTTTAAAGARPRMCYPRALALEQTVYGRHTRTR